MFRIPINLLSSKRSIDPRPDTEQHLSSLSRNPTPIMYPALLSRVAEAFRERIQLAEREKDGSTYEASFNGQEAVDEIANIIDTANRDLAASVGRALEAQHFFRNVTDAQGLADSTRELYQFKGVSIPIAGGELADANADGREEGLPNGVFTPLTGCYSPACSRGQFCYSYACPRRVGHIQEHGTSCAHSEPLEIADSVSHRKFGMHIPPPSVVGDVGSSTLTGGDTMERTEKPKPQASDLVPEMPKQASLGDQLASTTGQPLTAVNESTPEIPGTKKALADVPAADDRTPAPNRQPHVEPKSSQLRCCIIC